MESENSGFSKAFNIIRAAYSGEFTTNIEDAFTHRHIIYDMGYGNNHPYPVKSFRAVVEHIRAETNNPEFEQAYTTVFADRGFCKRIIKGQNI
jgi:hypothetical protein